MTILQIPEHSDEGLFASTLWFVQVAGVHDVSIDFVPVLDNPLFAAVTTSAEGLLRSRFRRHNIHNPHP